LQIIDLIYGQIDIPDNSLFFIFGKNRLAINQVPLFFGEELKISRGALIIIFTGF